MGVVVPVGAARGLAEDATRRLAQRIVDERTIGKERIVTRVVRFEPALSMIRIPKIEGL